MSRDVHRKKKHESSNGTRRQTVLRRRGLLLCLAVVMLSSIALGKAVKQELLGEDDQVLGKAKLNYAKGANKTEIQVNCRGLEAETEYLVLLFEFDGGGEVADWFELGSFTTNKKGKGRLHARVDGDVSDWCVVVGVVDGNIVYPCAGGPDAGDVIAGVVSWWLEWPSREPPCIP